MNKLSERDICTKFITPALEKSGWDIKKQIRENVSKIVAQMEATQKSMIGGGDIPEADKKIITGEKNNKILTRFNINIENFKREIKDSELDIDTSVNFVSDKGSVSFNLGEFKMLLDDGTLIVADQRHGLAKIDLSGNVTPFGNLPLTLILKFFDFFCINV